MGILNSFYVFIIIVSGDLVGDTAVYLLGRWSKQKSKHLEKIKKLLGLNKEHTTNATIVIEANPFKTIALSKIVLGIGVAGILWEVCKDRLPKVYGHLLFHICPAIHCLHQRRPVFWAGIPADQSLPQLFCYYHHSGCACGYFLDSG